MSDGSGVSIDDCFAVADIQAQHCATGLFKGLVTPELHPARMSTVQNLRKSGQ